MRLPSPTVIVLAVLPALWLAGPCAAAARPDAARLRPDSATASVAAEVRVARARAAWLAGDPLGVVEQLEPLQLALESGAFVPERDRAALLLAESYLALGARLRFLELTRRATAHLPAGPSRDWLALRRALVEGTLPEGMPGPIGATPEARLRELLVAREQRPGGDGTPALDSLATRWPDSRAARAARLHAAAGAVDRGDWADARGRYEELRASREQVLAWLDETESQGLGADAWLGWEAGLAERGAVVVPESLLARAVQAVTGAAATGRSPEPPWAVLPGAERVAGVPLAPLEPEEAARLAAASSAIGETRAVIAALRREQAAEAAERARLGAYLESGLVRARREAAVLEERRVLLDSLARRSEMTARELAALRDAWIARVGLRLGRMRSRAEQAGAWTGAMVHFHLQGPRRQRPHAVPEGLPRPDSVLSAERQLTAAIAALAAALDAELPERIARAHDAAWRPSLVERIMRLQESTRLAIAGHGRATARIDSARAALADSPRARELAAALQHAESALAATLAEESATRSAILAAGVARTREALAREREALDYGLAVTAWVRAVATPDTITERAHWQQVAERELDHFLATHPASEQRGEMRFRAADLAQELARSRFDAAMAEYVAAGREGRVSGPLPQLSQARALALYRAILAEDPAFPHRDAARFNAGMILADAGSDEAMAMFAALLRDHPQSRHVQEGRLRMADLHFAAERFAESVPLYRDALTGPDTTLRAIAGYKAGWALFREDRFDEAADAFRGVLDLHASGVRLDRGVDLADEAESYLLHSLARGGGAAAWRRQRDRLGPEADAERRLRALAQHLRRYRQDAAAVAVDALHLEEFPEHPNALLSMERMVETLQRSERGAEARRIALAHASSVAPEGPWWRAQRGDSLRAAGARFAQRAWGDAAVAAHQEARRSRVPADWRRALEHYRTLLTRFPEAHAGGPVALQAAEAARELGDDASARQWLEQAAGAGADSVRDAALWQLLALEDARYESGRGAALRGDSLRARRVIAAASGLVERSPNHPRRADARWRGAQLLVAHGAVDEAVPALESWLAEQPADARVPLAAAQRADALARLGRWDEAEAAYADAATRARATGRDSLARRAEAARPVAAYRAAERFATDHPTDPAGLAARFARVAADWPGFEHAPRAQYRAALAWGEAGDRARERVALVMLRDRFPRSEFARDAQLALARHHERDGDPAAAASELMTFVRTHPADSLRSDAWLHAAELWSRSGRTTTADSLRRAWVRAYPSDSTGVTENLELLAARELDRVDAQRPVSRLLVPGARSDVQAWLAHGRRHPARVSAILRARLRFLQGEEARERAERVALVQPLPRSLAERQRHQEQALAHYRAAVDGGERLQAHAAATRIGQLLATFASALEKSEVPKDLRGDDRIAYGEVLRERAQPFRERAIATWSDLLRRRRGSPDDAWLEQARSGLATLLADRFLFRPEVEMPRVAAPPPLRREPPLGHAESDTLRTPVAEGGGR